jgi:RHS repeat-associated protein
VGQGYDANGNQTSPPNNSGELLYDAENRLTQNSVSEQYAYDSQNKRVWVGTLVSGSLTSQSASLYGIDGQKLGTYSLSVSSTEITDAATSLSVYFAGKRVAIAAAGVTTPFVQDRLGSNMSWAIDRVSLYPWGEDRGTPAPNDQIKFATYTRDSATLLDYGDQRYYGNAEGRFATPDPAGANAANPRKPASWNRYAYAGGDPVNRNDPTGLSSCALDDPLCNPFAVDPDDDDDDDGGEGITNPCFASNGFEPMPSPFCQGGGPPETPVPQDSCDLRLTAEIKALLTSKNSPLASYSAWFVAVGLMDDIDPRLLVAMSGAESGFGTSHVATADNNAFGILHKVGQSYVPVVYSSFGVNVSAAGNVVENQVYNRGNDTVNLLYSGQPGAYCQNTPGFPCSSGAANVTKFLVGMGGNPNDLAFPCPE